VQQQARLTEEEQIARILQQELENQKKLQLQAQQQPPKAIDSPSVKPAQQAIPLTFAQMQQQKAKPQQSQKQQQQSQKQPYVPPPKVATPTPSSPNPPPVQSPSQNNNNNNNKKKPANANQQLKGKQQQNVSKDASPIGIPKNQNMKQQKLKI
jgi:hypothetical protein